MVLTILIIVYRNVVAMLLPLATIGVSLVVAQQVVAGARLVGLPLGPQTLVLMTGMMLGAGTDYAVFLFSRYHECVRTGMSSDDALVAALGSIGEVVTGSAGTVAITFFGLAVHHSRHLPDVGPALTVTIAVGFLAAITMLPALIVLAGRRGWIKPRKDMTGRFWRRSGDPHRRAGRRSTSRSASSSSSRWRRWCPAGQLQLRRPQDPAGRRPEQPRLHGHGCALPGRGHAAAVPHRPSRPTADLRSPKVAGRSGADGPAGEPAARHRPGARHHPTDRSRCSSRPRPRYQAGRGRRQAARRVDADLSR